MKQVIVSNSTLSKLNLMPITKIAFSLRVFILYVPNPTITKRTSPHGLLIQLLVNYNCKNVKLKLLS